MTINKSKLTIAMAAALGIGASGIVIPTAAQAQTQQQTIQQLKAQLEELQNRLEELERQQIEVMARPAEPAPAPQTPTPQNVTEGDRPGTYKLPGTETSIKLGGYVKLDAIYNFNEDLGDSLFVPAVNTDPDVDPPEGSARLHARQSRLFISSWTPTRFGELRTHWEGDFFGGGGNQVFSNSTTLRIRHAYGQLGGLLTGQTWSNFMQFAAYPTTVDFSGPMGVSFIRQGQIRYTHDIDDNTNISFSLENPEGTGYENANDPFPDTTVAFRWGNGVTNIEAMAVGRYLEFDDGTNDDATFGYGLQLAGNYTIADTTLKGGVLYGEGIGRYLYLADGARGVGAAFIDEDGDLETVEAYGFVAAIEQQWNDTLKSVLAYGRTAGDRPGPESLDKLETIHANLLWTPIPRTIFGVEYQWAGNTRQNGDDGDANRVQFAAQYNF